MSASAVIKFGSTGLSSGGLPVVSALLFQATDYVSENHRVDGWCEHRLVTSCEKARKSLLHQGVDLLALYFKPLDAKDEFAAVLAAMKTFGSMDDGNEDDKFSAFHSDRIGGGFDKVEFVRWLLTGFLRLPPYSHHLDRDFFNLYSGG